MRAFRTPLLLLAMAAALPACGGPEADLVVYASHDQEHSEPIIRRFEEQTGLTVEAHYDVEQNKTVGLVNRLLAERKNPYADVFWNNEIAHTIRLKRAGLTQPCESEATRAIPAEFRDPEGHWVGFAARARVIMYRQDLLDAADTELPTSILAMSDPAHAPHGVLARPLTGTTLTHFAVLAQMLGRNTVLAWLEKARDSELSFTNGNATAMRRVCQGDFPWCLTDTDDAAAARANGYDVALSYPDQNDALAGTLLIPNTAIMVQGARHPDAAQRFIDFLCSPATEEYLARSRSAQIPLHPDAQPPAGLPLPIRDYQVLAVDWEAAAAELDEVQDAFDALFTQ